ncbi:MAG: SAM-dependent methyltransferase [Thermoprotei archaeon]|nr:MAG: SAM-dependent methyltransferase [Thermoprotei archaeon]
MVSLVPFVPTPEIVIHEMLKLAELKPGEILYDLGCGDGRILMIAAKEFGAKAIGVEIRKDLVEACIKNIKKNGLEGKAYVIHGDFFNVDISSADVITLYLLTSVNEKLKPKLKRETKNGVRIVSHDFEITGWTPLKKVNMRNGWRTHNIYLYTLRR